MVPVPQVSNVREVEYHVVKLHRVVPFVVRADPFVGRQPILDVVVVSAAEDGGVSLTKCTGTEDGGLRRGRHFPVVVTRRGRTEPSAS